MYCAIPSEWGLFGRNTRSAIQGTSSRKCYGKDTKGRPFYGPGETYIYHCHEGEWSEGAKKNRTLFQEVQLLAKQELEDPERVAYWQPLFEKQFKHPKQGEKRYATLRGFVIAQIHQQLKKEQAG